MKALKKKHPEDGAVAVTASTALAALNIGGSTLHKFCGIGNGEAPLAELVRGIKCNVNSRNRWTKARVLVIDEGTLRDVPLARRFSLTFLSVHDRRGAV